MTTSSGESGFTPNGFSALVSPLSLLVSPPPLAQADRSEPPPVATTEARMARCRNSRREYWFGVLMGLPLLCADTRGGQAVRRMRPAYRASRMLLWSSPPGTLADR